MSTSKLIVGQKTWGDNRQLPSVYRKFFGQKFWPKNTYWNGISVIGGFILTLMQRRAIAVETLNDH